MIFYIKLYSYTIDIVWFTTAIKLLFLKYMHNNILFDTVPDPILNCSWHSLGRIHPLDNVHKASSPVVP